MLISLQMILTWIVNVRCNVLCIIIVFVQQDLLYISKFFIVWKLDLLMTQKDCGIDLDLFMSDNRGTYSYSLMNILIYLCIQLWYEDDADSISFSITCKLQRAQSTSRYDVFTKYRNFLKLNKSHNHYTTPQRLI